MFLLTDEEILIIWRDTKAITTARLCEEIAQAQLRRVLDKLEEECLDHWDHPGMMRWDCDECRRELPKEAKI